MLTVTTQFGTGPTPFFERRTPRQTRYRLPCGGTCAIEMEAVAVPDARTRAPDSVPSTSPAGAEPGAGRLASAAGAGEPLLRRLPQRPDAFRRLLVDGARPRQSVRECAGR